MYSSVRKWLFLIASGAYLMGTGCPNTDEIKNVFADSVEGVANTVIVDFFSGIFGTGV